MDAWGTARGPPGGPLCKGIGPDLLKNFFYLRPKKIFGGGADPQTGGGNPSEIGGISSAGGALQDCIETDAANSKTTEISGSNKYLLAPSSDQKERRSLKRDQSTVATDDTYKCPKFGGPSSLRTGDMVDRRFCQNRPTIVTNGTLTGKSQKHERRSCTENSSHTRRDSESSFGAM